jgi:hypothetical protein
MHAQASAPRNGILAVHGYGIKIHVYRRHLVIDDGIGRDRRTRSYHRTSKLRRLVLVGRTGYITLEAIRWLHDVGAALVHIDADGRLLVTSSIHGRNLPALRRAQALAPISAAGRQVARELLQTKVAGQLSLLPELSEGEPARPEIERALAAIEAGTTVRDLLDAEARAAVAYWAAWASLPVPIATRGRQQEHSIPEHWRAFGQRHSLITSGPENRLQPSERNPQLPLRAPGGRDHVCLPRRWARSGDRNLSHGPARSRLACARSNGGRSPRGRCLCPRVARQTHALGRRLC